MKRAPWYKESGLNFSCTACAECCKGAGYVWVEKHEIRRLAKHLEMSYNAFTKKYVRAVNLRLALIDSPSEDCIFLGDDDHCRVYDVRPDQCRTWPFWKKNVASPRSWKETVKVCPGTGEGENYTFERIQKILFGKAETTIGGQTSEPSE